MDTIKTYNNLQTMHLEGDLVLLDDLVKYLHGQIKISDTNRKAFEEECRHIEKHSDEWKWKMIEAMKSESEMNAFILVLQALGKNPIKETK
jgi:hypothetical protein